MTPERQKSIIISGVVLALFVALVAVAVDMANRDTSNPDLIAYCDDFVITGAQMDSKAIELAITNAASCMKLERVCEAYSGVTVYVNVSSEPGCTKKGETVDGCANDLGDGVYQARVDANTSRSYADIMYHEMYHIMLMHEDKKKGLVRSANSHHDQMRTCEHYSLDERFKINLKR